MIENASALSNLDPDYNPNCKNGISSIFSVTHDQELQNSSGVRITTSKAGFNSLSVSDPVLPASNFLNKFSQVFSIQYPFWTRSLKCCPFGLEFDFESHSTGIW